LRERNKIIETFHTSKVNIHPGNIGTLKLIRKYHQWPNMYAQIRERINSCATCKKYRSERQKPEGLLIPSAAANKPMEHLAGDILGPLPPSSAHIFIILIVD
jgi:Integrase zinc binding domain